jgi:hypothetical protein
VTSRTAFLALLVLLVPTAGVAKPSAKWMAHCAANLKGEGKSANTVRVYCACMNGLDDEPEMLKLTQTELERSWPPVHVQCHKKAGWK